jgi:hypothetical protein
MWSNMFELRLQTYLTNSQLFVEINVETKKNKLAQKSLKIKVTSSLKKVLKIKTLFSNQPNLTLSL